MTDLLFSAEAWVSLATLVALEVVLGIDNLIFITILASRLPIHQRDRARRIGLAGAFVTRMGLLGTIAWLVRLDSPLFTIHNVGFSGKSLILLGGGLFLIYKATREIHHKLENATGTEVPRSSGATLRAVLVQIVLLDLVFSIDSVITAVGMTDVIAIMVAANAVALIVMLVVGKGIASFVERHPSIKVLALAFLLMVGLVLVAEGFGAHIGKGYIYGAMGFSIFVEMINIRSNRKPEPSSERGRSAWPPTTT